MGSSVRRIGLQTCGATMSTGGLMRAGCSGCSSFGGLEAALHGGGSVSKGADCSRCSSFGVLEAALVTAASAGLQN